MKKTKGGRVKLNFDDTQSALLQDAQKAAPKKRSYMVEEEKRQAAIADKVADAQSAKQRLVSQQEADRQRDKEAAEQRKRNRANSSYSSLVNMGIMGFNGTDINYNVSEGRRQEELKKADQAIAEAGKQSEFDKGRSRAIEILGTEGLGRLEEDIDIQRLIRESGGREEELAKYTKMAEGQLDRQRDLTSRYEKMAEEGISPEAREAMRVSQAQLMAKQEQMAGMRLGAALGGAKGAAAMAQQRSLAAAGMQARAGIERDIFLQSEAAKERGLAGMAASLSGEQAAITGIGQGQQMQQAAFESRRAAIGEMKAFDIGQAAAEKELIATMGLQYEQMASAEKQAKMAADAQAAAGGGGCHVTGTKVLMKDETYKNIEDLKIGDEIMLGGKVLGCGSLLTPEPLYTMNNEIFTASHLVYDSVNKIYLRADETEACKLYKQEANTVVHPIFTENRCYITSFVSGDFGMETEYREEREDITYTIKGLGYGR